MITTASHTFIELHRKAVAGVQANLAQALDFYNASRTPEERDGWRECVEIACDALDSLSDDIHS